MTPRQFVRALRSLIVDHNTSFYCETLARLPANDGDGDRLRAFYHGLSTEQKEVLDDLVRKVAVDTASNVLSVLDGELGVPGHDDVRLVLKQRNGILKLNGALALMLLEEEEDARAEGR